MKGNHYFQIDKKLFMEKFMFIFHGSQPDGMSPDEMQAHMGKWFAWIEQLSKEDKYVAGEALMPGGKLVGGPGGKNVTDGPYTEGKEVVGGFFVVNAKDINEAVALARNCPDYEL